MENSESAFNFYKKNLDEILIVITLNLHINFWVTDILKILYLLINEHDICLVIYVSLNFPKNKIFPEDKRVRVIVKVHTAKLQDLVLSKAD